MALFNQQFLSTYIRQRFALPDSLIYYIMKNPKSSQLYQKLIQCCKYLFIKNPILVIHCLHVDDDGWKICSNQNGCKEVFVQLIDGRIISSYCKLWILNRIGVFSTGSNAASNLVPKIYKCDATRSLFANQNISLPQFLLYAQNAEVCGLNQVIVNSEVCAEIPLEEIVANLPNVSLIAIKYGPDSKLVSPDTATKLMKIPHFKNVTKMLVVDGSGKLDMGPIFDHYKKNRSRFTFRVYYQNELSEAVVEKLDGYVFEILDYKFHNNETPVIVYLGQTIFDHNALLKMHKHSLLSLR